MKILHIVSSTDDNCGGPTVGAKNLAKALVSIGNNASICGTRSDIGKTRKTLMDDYSVYEFPARNLYYYNQRLGIFLGETIEKYDIVHIHGIWTYPTFMASRISRIKNIPYIIRTCGMLSDWNMLQKRIRKIIYFHLVEKHIINTASFIQFSTEAEREKSFYGKYLGRRIKYIPNIIDFEAIEKSDNVPDERLINKKYILFAGRLCYKKGLDVLIEAFALLRQDPLYKDIYVVLMGTGHDNFFSNLRKKDAYLRVKDYIINLGVIYGNSRFRIFKNALFLCLPSRQENLGMVVVESLGCGVPVVVSTSVDMAPFIINEHLGKLSEINPRHLCSVMAEMINSEKELRKMGQNGKEFVYDKFEKKRVLGQYIEMYREAVSIKNIGKSCLNH